MFAIVKANDEDGGPPLARVVQVDARPLHGGGRFAGGAPATLDPGPERNQQRARAMNSAGSTTKKTMPDVRVGVEAEQIGQEDDEKQRRR